LGCSAVEQVEYHSTCEDQADNEQSFPHCPDLPRMSKKQDR
jgi:hypothetical protein